MAPPEDRRGGGRNWVCQVLLTGPIVGKPVLTRREGSHLDSVIGRNAHPLKRRCWRRPKSVVILSVVDLDVPQELSLAWRKDNHSHLLASFVADVAAVFPTSVV